jgi:hypothetical protein
MTYSTGVSQARGRSAGEGCRTGGGRPGVSRPAGWIEPAEHSGFGGRLGTDARARLGGVVRGERLGAGETVASNLAAGSVEDAPEWRTQCPSHVGVSPALAEYANAAFVPRKGSHLGSGHIILRNMDNRWLAPTALTSLRSTSRSASTREWRAAGGPSRCRIRSSAFELRAEDRSIQALGGQAHTGWRHDPTGPARARKESYAGMYLLGDLRVGRRAARAEGGL